MESLNSILVSREKIQQDLNQMIKLLGFFNQKREQCPEDEQKKIKEETLQKLLNDRILLREFFNDFVGILLKSISVYMATSG